MENAMTSLNNRADFDRCLHHIDSALFSAMFIAHQEAGVARIIDRDGIERIVDKMEEMHLNSEHCRRIAATVRPAQSRTEDEA
jgi:hypothetical protein